MVITSLHIRHFRSHTQRSVDFPNEVSLIVGANGSGKTSLLEAIYVALQGSSFKGSDMEMIENGAPWYRIDVTFDDKTVRTVKFDPSKTSGRKQFIIGGKTSYRMTSQYKYPVVLFEPDDLRLISGSPTRRRQFIDDFISQLDPHYALALRRYERALKQRNALLKRAHATHDDLFAWNVSLSEHGAYIIERRLFVIGELNNRLADAYSSIAHTDDTVTIRYSEKTHANLKQKLLADLHAHSEKDALLGFTSTGPHRHDLLFDFNGMSALSVASRGETRSIVLALKFLEIAIIEQITQKKPVVLLDDVFSELDEARQSHLLKKTEYQIILTSTSYAQPLLPYMTKLTL